VSPSCLLVQLCGSFVASHDLVARLGPKQEIHRDDSGTRRIRTHVILRAEYPAASKNPGACCTQFATYPFFPAEPRGNIATFRPLYTLRDGDLQATPAPGQRQGASTYRGREKVRLCAIGEAFISKLTRALSNMQSVQVPESQDTLRTADPQAQEEKAPPNSRECFLCYQAEACLYLIYS
jgi:hypothetical protein